jgi:hypothetical protein
MTGPGEHDSEGDAGEWTTNAHLVCSVHDPEAAVGRKSSAVVATRQETFDNVANSAES